ncbi:hypothetical protein RJ640_020483 [Escallonia rubra]|uniref:BAHD acyltransferase n=1 Tax=Escallonia rubra TaxID=112253 RepID=A0AA88RKM7_9ASTE|nr:hypothetical protein RJ640_020483 [Escallonia rubra]
MLPSKHKQSKCVTRRIRFNASAISALKEKAAPAVPNPSRVVTVTSFIWKCATAASRAKGGSVKPSVLSLAVNLRNRCSPPLPEYTIGNNVWGAVAFSLPHSELELHSVVAGLTDGIAKVNSEFVEEIKGEEGLLKLAESIKQFREMHSNAGADYYAATSVCNGGLYDADFGWGKPIWVSIGNGSADLPMLTNIIFLMDTSKHG